MEREEIGGFLELDLNDKGTLYHDRAISVNTGRNALEYILVANQYSKVYIPYYTCEAILEPIKKLGVQFSFYSIDENLYPIFQFESLKRNEAFLYTNYFGLCRQNTARLARVCDNLILDNAQAFFEYPLTNIPTIYSPRKFFGVSDGGFLYNERDLGYKFEIDHSLNRLEHLIGRLEYNAESFYKIYQKNEDQLSGESIKAMSKLTKLLLCNVDYELSREIRKRNFCILQEALKKYNKLNLRKEPDEVPLCYPFLLDNGSEIKRWLIKNKIYVPTFWPNVLITVKPTSFEYFLTENIVCLPIDQRYGEAEMEKIITILNLKLEEYYET